MQTLTKKEYKEDIEYLFNFLKENSPFSHLIDYDKYKNKIIKSNIINKFKNRADLYIFISKFFSQKEINDKVGHLFIKTYNRDDNIDDLINKEIKNNYLFLKKNLKNSYKKEDFYEEFDTANLKQEFIDFVNQNSNLFNYSEENDKDNNLIKNEFYKYGIIKDDNNKDVIYIKLYSFYLGNINQENLNFYSILGFIYSHKELNDLYIDLRGNSGGDLIICEGLLSIIYKGILKPRFDNIKLYYKYTKYNKGFIDDTLKKCNVKTVKELHNNKDNFTHYIIQKQNNININYKNHYSGFKGNIYIIVDKNTYSSAQYFVDLVQYNKNFTILGDELTMGSGLLGFNINNKTPEYISFILPNSNMIIQIDPFYYDINLSKSKPDKPIPPFLKSI